MWRLGFGGSGLRIWDLGLGISPPKLENYLDKLGLCRVGFI